MGRRIHRKGMGKKARKNRIFKKYNAPKKGGQHYWKGKKVYIPPAWKDVKFVKGNSYIATGVDEKGRKQYVYPEERSQEKSKEKFKRIDNLEKEMPAILKQIMRDGKEESDAIYTIYKTGFRPGTEKDTQADKEAHGALTLKGKEVKVKGDKVIFDFVGKKGVDINKEVRDKKLAQIMKPRIKNKDLFDTNATNVRRYFYKKTDGKYQLKDLRTLKANTVAGNIKGDKKDIAKKVSEELGNTPKVALDSYINPKIIK